MIFKLSPRAPVFSIAAVLLAALETVSAQVPTPTPNPARRVPTGFVRLVNATSPAENVTYQIRVSADPNAQPLQSATPGNFLAIYDRIRPGRYSVRLTKSGAGDLTVKSFDATIPDMGYFTVLVYPDAAGAIAAELVDDTPDFKKLPANRLVVREFCKDMRVLVTSGGQRTGPLEYGQTQTLENLPDGKSNVQIRSATAKGPRNWGSEVDFNLSRRATAYIVPDPYGRMRTRFTVDGPDPKTEKEDRDAIVPSAPQ